MTDGNNGHILVFDQRLSVKTFIRQDHEAHIDPTFGDPLGHRVIRPFINENLDFRIADPILLEDSRQQE